MLRDRLRLPALCIAALAACGVPDKTKAGTDAPQVVDRALHQASTRYGVPYWQLRNVSWCESRWNTHAVGPGGSLGLFQFLPSTWAGTPYGRRSVFDPWANAMAAAYVVRRDGGWSEWTCRP